MSVETTPAPVVLTEAHEGVLTVTLNRPEVLNALNNELLDSLAAVLHDAQGDAEVRALVITGSGRGFSSGQDLKSAASAGMVDIRRVLHEHYVPVITALRTIEKPVIAAVNGVAAGAGFSLALACDLRIASESASFVQAFVRIGLVPDAGSTFFLPALIGYARAAELMMLGETVGSAEALRLGIVNRVVPDDRLMGATAGIAGRLAQGPRSIGLIKRLLGHTLDPGHDLQTQLRHEGDAQAEAATSADFLEGISAFLEKRAPRFSGR